MNLIKCLVLMTFFLSSIYGADLEIEIVDLISIEGNLIVSLYTSEEEFPDFENALETQVLPADSINSVQFSELERGEYAVSVIHDENSDMKLQQWFWVGPPKEGVGASGESSGIPSFETAQFTVEEELTQIVIEMEYLGKD